MNPPAPWLTTARRIWRAYQDREFYTRLWHLAIPITLQQFIMASLNMVGNLIIGQLGEVSIAAVGLGGQIFFLFNLLLFGLGSGAAIFTAQYWGQRDVPNIRRVLGLGLALGLSGAALFSGVMLIFPEAALGIYSRDPAVVALGAQYLRAAGWGTGFMAVSFMYAVVLRSLGQVRLPLVVNSSAIILNAVLTYALVFGLGGLPALGVRGAGVALSISRIVECLALLTLAYGRRTPVACGWRALVDWSWPFVRRILERMAPVALNEILWSLGVTTYNIIYARMGTEALAAMNILAPIDMLAFVAFIGLGNACAILVGHQIGAGEEKTAFRYAGLSLGLSIAGGAVMGLAVYSLAGLILAFYKVSPGVVEAAHAVITVNAWGLWARAANMIIFVGILRSGGDTRFGFILDAGSIWVVGVPLAALGAFLWGWPIQGVYLLTLADEVNKLGFGVWRYLSRRWIQRVAIPN